MTGSLRPSCCPEIGSSEQGIGVIVLDSVQTSSQKKSKVLDTAFTYMCYFEATCPYKEKGRGVGETRKPQQCGLRLGGRLGRVLGRLGQVGGRAQRE